MSEEKDIPEKIRSTIKAQADKAMELLVDWVTKGESLESIIKSLIVQKIMYKLNPLISKTVLKMITKKIIEKAVDIAWENNKERLNKKIESLK